MESIEYSKVENKWKCEKCGLEENADNVQSLIEHAKKHKKAENAATILRNITEGADKVRKIKQQKENMEIAQKARIELIYEAEEKKRGKKRRPSGWRRRRTRRGRKESCQ